MTMDYLMLPPEINSARMYTGPGAGPLIAAASAWASIAAELHTTSASITSAVNGLTTASWLGPSSLDMLAASSLYTNWLSTTAEQAQLTSAQAMAAVSAYEAAFAATVPPTVVAANRGLLAQLVATNFLGINTAAIAATEAQYAEMWAQDVAAMVGYHAGSSQATTLTPFSPLSALTKGAPVASVSSATGTVQNTLSGLQNFMPQSFSDLMSAAQAFSGMGVMGMTGPMMVMDEGLWGAPTWKTPDSDPAPVVDASAPDVTVAPAAVAPAEVSAAMGAAKPLGTSLSVPKSWPTPPSPTLVTPEPSINNDGFPFIPFVGAPANNKEQQRAIFNGRPRKVIPRHPSGG